MESTLEVRWFVRGKPPAAARDWFESDCLGKLLAEEVRQDWYANIQQNDLHRFASLLDRPLNSQEINLKLREGNLELKLRQQEFKIHSANSKHSPVCSGKIEQWHKFTQQELHKFGLPSSKLLERLNWVSVKKERQQKIEGGVKSELTLLKIHGKSWWSIAFEKIQNNRGDNVGFEEVVASACQKYPEPHLSAINSCGYSEWLQMLAPKIL